MTPKLEAAQYVADYSIRLRFEDGLEAVVDFESELWGEVFEPLRNLEVFRDFRLNEELNTLTWPCGADFAPEFLYDCVAARQGVAADADEPRQ